MADVTLDAAAAATGERAGRLRPSASSGHQQEDRTDRWRFPRGGRPITRALLRSMLTGAAAGTLGPLSFLDLNRGLVERELMRARR